MNKAESDTPEKKEPSFGKLLDALNKKIHWKTAKQGGALNVYRPVQGRFFELLTPSDCKMEVRRHMKKLPPGLIASLSTALQEDEARLFDLNLFVETRKKGIGFKNGFFDITTGKLREYHSNDFVLDPLPLDIPERRDPEVEEYFEKVIKQWVGENVGGWFINLLAYLLFIFPNKEQIWVNFFGQGSNGKSVCLRILEEILGYEKIIGCDLSNLNRFSNATFEGKWLVVGRDSSELVSEGATSFIKNYSGDERSLVERKGGASYDVVTAGKLIVSTNKLIKSKDRTFSWFRRIIPVSFPNEFARDPDFEEDLIKKVPAICRFLLHRAYCYRSNKIPVAKYLPGEVQTLINETRWTNDRVSAFCELYFKRETEEHTFEADTQKIYDLHLKSMTQVYDLYCQWHCDQFGELAIEPSIHSFGGKYGAFMTSDIGKKFELKRLACGKVLELKEGRA